jgi:hypothetical protein
VKDRAQSEVGSTFENRSAHAGCGVPEVDLVINARRGQRAAVGAPGRRLSACGRRDRPDGPSRCRLENVAGRRSEKVSGTVWPPSAMSRTVPDPFSPSREDHA